MIFSNFALLLGMYEGITSCYLGTLIHVQYLGFWGLYTLFKLF